MPSVRYYNQTAPFWDFVASMEDRGANHPFFADRRDGAGPSEGPRAGPWGWGMPFGGHGPMPHHPHHHRSGHHGHHRGPHPAPPPPPHGDHPSPPPPPGEKDPFSDSDGERDPEKMPTDGDQPEQNEQTPNDHQNRNERRRSCHGRRGRHGGRGGWGGWRGFWGQGGPPMGGFENFADFFGAQMRGEDNNNENRDVGQDFKPEADVFDTEAAFIIDIPLAGAKREDVGVSWDAEKSELSVGGVVYRNGDEEFLKTLAMAERKIGPFERKIRLGSRARPAQIDADAINAKLEDGVLRITVPKLDKDYVEIKKVDIE